MVKWSSCGAVDQEGQVFESFATKYRDNAALKPKLRRRHMLEDVITVAGRATP